MSGIAESAGVGRATLYKYFPDIESILVAWHERQVSQHLKALAAVGDNAAHDSRLADVLEKYAVIAYERRDSGPATWLHQDAHLVGAQVELVEFIQHLIEDGVASGTVRDDVPPAELAEFCLHALAAAGAASSEDAARRLAAITLDGIRPRSHGGHTH